MTKGLFHGPGRDDSNVLLTVLGPCTTLFVNSDHCFWKEVRLRHVLRFLLGTPIIRGEATVSISTPICIVIVTHLLDSGPCLLWI